MSDQYKSAIESNSHLSTKVLVTIWCRAKDNRLFYFLHGAIMFSHDLAVLEELNLLQAMLSSLEVEKQS